MQDGRFSVELIDGVPVVAAPQEIDITNAADLRSALLEAAGYLTRTRTGRRTRYTVHHDSLFRHPAQDGHRVGPFLTLLAAGGENARTAPEPEDSRD